MRPPLLPTLKARALRLLAAREHSRAELDRKLSPHAASLEELVLVLDALAAKGFIRDDRVLESVLHQKSAKFGTARVIYELQRKGLSEELIGQAQEDLQKTELRRGIEVWRRKFGSRARTLQEKARQVRFMATRGFSQEAIRKILSQMDAENGPG